MVAVRCASPELYWITVGADGYLASVTDAINRSVSFTRDADGRVLSTQLPDGRVVSASYDANSNLTSLTPPGRPAHSFSYTSRDLTQQYTPPTATPGGPTGYTWNADGQPVSKTQPDGDIITSGYDLAGRPSTLTIPRGSFGYGYDGLTGKLASVTGPAGFSQSYTYQGSLLASLNSGGPVAGSVAWTYDNNFRTTTRTVNGANGIALGYDSDDRSTSLGSLTMSRNAQNGLLTGTTLGSVTEALNYSTFGEVSSYTASAGASQLYSESYVRDNLGRITQRTETLQGTTTVWAYSYDTVGRLSSVTRNGSPFESYTFDPNGNRVTKTTTAGTSTNVFDNQDRLVSSSGLGGTQSWVNDANGDLVTQTNSAGTTSFDYDTTGQLSGVTKPGGQTISYELDASNKRAVKRVNGIVQRKWLYAGGLLPVAEYDANDNLIAVFNGGYMVKNAVTYSLLRDQLGSVRLVVDVSTGTVVQSLSYGPWGEVLEDTNPGFQPFGYAGGLYDPDTGLVRFGARDYDPSIGRWTRKDPVGLLAGSNVYAYCGNNPVNSVDISGLEETIEDIKYATYERARKLTYWGGTRDPAMWTAAQAGNCVGYTLGGFLEPYMSWEKGLSLLNNPALFDNMGTDPDRIQIGDIALFNGHLGTVVDFDVCGDPIIFGRDGYYGLFSGKPSDYTVFGGKPTYYRNKQDYSLGTHFPLSDAVAEYRHLVRTIGPSGVHPENVAKPVYTLPGKGWEKIWDYLP